MANVYYAQPLLERMGSDLSISTGRVGWVVALGQAGYLVGLAALVPLGDWLNRRMLIPAHLLLIAVGTTVAALSTTAAVLYAGVAIAGLFAVVVQTAVAYTAAKSLPSIVAGISGSSPPEWWSGSSWPAPSPGSSPTSPIGAPSTRPRPSWP
ncbi:MFS transporter [Actinopolyspora mzabensis]|uniref:MFS transporter n=1 Tax=Actinopolyspora mzabensis TaxID=995066 RepID=UPI001C409A9E|nr:MFS transporter [Actinopolyspora mzabensis]